MSDPRTYPAGVPCWVDTEQPDPGAAERFYGELFGWDFGDARVRSSPGSYRIASLHGHDVAAIGAESEDPARWHTYIAVDDIDASTARVASGGGYVANDPVTDGSAGRGAACVDPTGASFRLWQARDRPGAQLTNAADTWNFSDLHTDDLAAAEAFYASVFGWEADELDLGGGAAATMWRRPGYGDHLEATVDPGIRARQADVGAPASFADAIAWLAPSESGTSPHWHVTFTVDDRDDAVATAQRLGASVVSSSDAEWTKAAVIRDPQGAVLTLSQFTPGEAV